LRDRICYRGECWKGDPLLRFCSLIRDLETTLWRIVSPEEDLCHYQGWICLGAKPEVAA